METLNSILGTVSNWLFGTILIWLLIGVGLFFTIATRGVQLRHLGSIVRAVVGSRSGAQGGISSFQAFAVGLACRVGTGNIVGVALALVLGGPGAVLWMWVVALVGTATAFAEASLGQLFKVRRGDGTFRGGPAYYLARGLHLPVVGGVFAVVFMIANGLAMPMVQANAMTAALGSAAGVSPWWGAAIVALLVAPVLLGGLRSIARVTEWMAPLMAIVYLLLVAVIIVTHQAFGVLVDTLLVCTATALAILIAGVNDPAVYTPGVTGAQSTDISGTLTQTAIASTLGEWTSWPMTLLIIVLAYSTILGAFSYAEVCLDFLTRRAWVTTALRIGAVACTFIGGGAALTTVWTLADVLLGIGACLNLAGIVALWKWVAGMLRDWEDQRAQRPEQAPSFVAPGNAYLPHALPGDVWTGPSQHA